MTFKVLLPSIGLQDIVKFYRSYQHVVNEEFHVQEFPTPILQALIFNFKESAVKIQINSEDRIFQDQVYFLGQASHKRTLNFLTFDVFEMLGVDFHPLGIYKLTGIHMEEIADKIVNVEDIWGSEIIQLYEQMCQAHTIEARITILESFLFKKLQNIKKNGNTCVSHALRLMELSHGNTTLKTLRDYTSTTPKTFERNFVQQIGILPKLYLRIIRYNKALQTLIAHPHISGQEVAFHYGYYDHAHFINEFKHFSGRTPSSFLASIRQTHSIK